MKITFGAALLTAALCLPEAGFAQDRIEIPADAAEMPKSGASSWCRDSNLRLNMQMNLNADFVKRLNDGVAEFQPITTEAVDPAAGSFSCRGVVKTVRGKTYRGTFNVVRDKEGLTQWWWANEQAQSASNADGPRIASNQSGSCAPTAGDQVAFVTAINAARNAYLAGQNEFQRGLTRPARAKQLCSIVASRKISNWTGRVKSLSATSEGQGVLGVEIEGANVEIRTARSKLSDFTGETLVRPNTPVFALMDQLQPGHCVRISGEFQPSDIDCVKEGSLTLEGTMSSPEFIFRFTTVQRAGAP